MPSSKFSSAPRSYKIPAVCKKVPPPFDPTWDKFYPPILTINFRVADYDPPIDYNFFGEFQIQREKDHYFYAGQSEGTTHFVRCSAQPIEFAGEWIFEFWITAPHLVAEHFVYTPNVPPELNRFDSRNIGEVNVPNLDFRYFRIYG